MKLVIVAVDLVTVLVLAKTLSAIGRDEVNVVAYAWHPFVAWEVAHSGHIDALAIAYLAGAILLAHRGRHATAGALVGLATIVKLYPIIVAPAFVRHGRLRFVLGLLAPFVLYVPYAGVGPRVLGFLPTYVREEGLDTGDRFFLVRTARHVFDLPTAVYVSLAVVAGLALALLIVRRATESSATRIANDCAALAAVALLLCTPHYAWYSIWLIAFACVAPRFAWLAMGTAGALLYYAPKGSTTRFVFDLAQYVLLGAAVVLALRRPSRATA
jgi:alpha-1,6-mannosyltransferase